MKPFPTLRTPRLILRPWLDRDLDAFAELNADPQVMQHLPELLDREAGDAAAERIGAHFARYGFGLWAVEIPGIADFIGFVGLSVPRFTAPFTPCVEVAWRLASRYWGNGYATEGAHAALAFGFDEVRLDAIVSFTVPANVPSIRVMERIGMKRVIGGDFNHPNLPDGHPLRRHVLYCLTRTEWLRLPLLAQPWSTPPR